MRRLLLNQPLRRSLFSSSKSPSKISRRLLSSSRALSQTDTTYMPLYIQSDQPPKVLSFIRHGTGFHNLAGEEGGPLGYWDERFLDAHLTPKGWAQTQLVRHHLERYGLLGKFELVVVSPLMRTLETASGIFGVPDASDPVYFEIAHCLHLHPAGAAGSGGPSSPKSPLGGPAKAQAGSSSPAQRADPVTPAPVPVPVPVPVPSAGRGDVNTAMDSSTERAIEGGPELPTVGGGRPTATSEELSPRSRAAVHHPDVSCKIKESQGLIPGVRSPWPTVIADRRTPPFLATDGCRERVTPHPCDARRDLHLTRGVFPGVCFDLVKPKDPVWTGQSEEDYTQLRERAESFLAWLEARPEKLIAIVSHGGFLMAVREAYLRRLHPHSSSAQLGAIRPPFNCEVMTTVLGHGHGLSPLEAKALDYIPHF